MILPKSNGWSTASRSLSYRRSASLAALRRMRPTQAHRARLIGFGDPLLDGRPDDPAQARRASEAPLREQSCAPIAKRARNGQRCRTCRWSDHCFVGSSQTSGSCVGKWPLPETTD